MTNGVTRSFYFGYDGGEVASQKESSHYPYFFFQLVPVGKLAGVMMKLFKEVVQ